MSPIPWRAAMMLTVASALLIAVLTLVPNRDTPIHGWCVVCGEVGGVDAVLNVALFLPFGVGLALLGKRAVTAIAAAGAGSIAIELLQLMIVSGRSATLGDVLTNTAGAALGFWLGANHGTLVRPAPRVAARMAVAAGLAWLGIQLVAAFSIVPSIPEAPHRAQVGRGLASTYQPFPGRVLSARVDARQLRPGDLPRDRPFFEIVLREGSVGEVTAVAHACPYRPAPLVHVGDSRYRELFILAAFGEDVVFGVRTGAEVLRLQPIRYRVPGVLGMTGGCTGRGNAWRVSAQYSRSMVTLQWTQGEGSPIAIRRQPRLSQAWALFVPLTLYRDGGPFERVLDLAWVVGLVLPAAFWSGLAATAGPRARATAGVATVVTLTVGFVVVPVALGIASATAIDWVAAVAAIALAWGVGTTTSANV